MRTLKILILLACAMAAGCGGGGGGGGSSPDMSGWWEFTMRQPGPSDPHAFVQLAPAAQSGSDVVYLGLDFTFDGATLTGADPDFDAVRRSEFHLTARSSELLEGQIHGIEPGAPTAYRDARMRRVAVPTGRLTAVGTAGGMPLDLNCPTAYAIVEDDPGVGSTDYNIAIVDAGLTDGNQLQLGFSLTNWLVFPIEKPISSSSRLRLTMGEMSYEATNGMFIFTEFAANERIRGTYQVIFGLDGTAEGTFDVQVRGTR